MLKFLAIVAVLCTGGYFGTGWHANQQLKESLTIAGYSNVSAANPMEPRFGVTVRGCTFVLKGQRFAPPARSVSGRQIKEFEVFTPQAGGELLRTDVDHAATKNELVAYMKTHLAQFPCFQKAKSAQGR